jgi:hypothetical protein
MPQQRSPLVGFNHVGLIRVVDVLISKAPSTAPSNVSRTTTSIVAFGCGISLLALSIALMSLFVMRRARRQTASQPEIDPFLTRERAYPQFVELSPQVRQGPSNVISNGKQQLLARQLPGYGHGSGGYSAVNSVSSPGAGLASSGRPLTTQASEQRSPQEHLPQLSRQGGDLSRAQSLGGSTLAWFPRCGVEPPPRYRSQSSGR